MTFHCHVFGVFMSTSRPLAGAPSEFPKQPSHGSTVVSSLRMPVSVVTNGGLVAMFNTGLRRSRWKNWPTPPRRAVFPVAEDIPGNPHARCDVVLVLRHQRAVRPLRTADRGCVFAPVLVGRLDQPVAGVGAECRVEERRDEARDLVVGRVRVVEERVPHAVVDRDTRHHLPRVGRIALEIAPALRGRAADARLREPPGHVLEQEVGEDVAASHCPTR